MKEKVTSGHKLTPIPADVVKPPRIAECPTHVECHIVVTAKTGDDTIFAAKSWQNRATLTQ